MMKKYLVRCVAVILCLSGLVGVAQAQTNSGTVAGSGSNSGTVTTGTNSGTVSAGGTNSGTVVGCGGTSGGLTNPLNVCDINALLAEVMKVVVQIGAVFLTIMLIYVGFLFVAARGNEEKVSNARTALLWTVIGGLVLLGAQAIATAITSTVTSL